ncbi:sodium-dependent glucose transporter 1A [Galendromus occidentalis]|uniref:Major facilitator superfamily domain-containing protein 4A n=1 Tax=Galendromus occidentalis TaxID=34638 RepID=A0AAJ6VZP3_9ACAR|nr:sodium-dependent glucose transporter 1A [Galendromus occidentalis]
MTVKLTRPFVDYWQSANQIMVVLGMSSSAGGKGLSWGIYGPSLMDLADIYSSAPNEVALMNSARALGSFLGSCLGGFLYEHVNDQILMMFTLAIYAVVTALIPSLPNITYLYILGFGGGAAVGISHIGSQVRLVKIWEKQSASAIQAFHTAFGVGAMIGPFVGAPFLSLTENGVTLKETRLYIPYVGFGIFFVVILVSMMAAYCLDPSSIKKTEKDDKSVNSPSSRTLEIVLMILLFFYIQTCVNLEITFSTLISVYAVKSPALQFSKADAAYLAGVFWTFFTGGRIVSIVVTVFFDIKQLLIISHSLSVCAAGILIVFCSSPPLAWVGAAVMGLGLSSMYGAVCGLVLQYFHVRHAHISVILTASCSGLALSAYFVPPIVEVRPMFLMYYSGAGSILHFMLLFVIILVTNGRPTIHSKKEEAQEARKEETAT